MGRELPLRRIGTIETLSDAVASRDSFGKLMMRGVDIDRLIQREPSAQVLEAACQKARDLGDLRWVVRMNQRLVEVSGLPSHRLDLARSLVWVTDYSAADSALPDESEDPALRPARAIVECQIALGLRDEDRAQRALRACLDAGGDGMQLRLRLVSAQLSWGKVDAAQAELDKAVEVAGMTASLAVLQVRIALSREGPADALRLLETLSAYLPPSSETYRALKLALLNERGRHNEAMDLAVQWLGETPLAVSLYPQSVHAAQHCDRVIELGRILEEIDAKYPSVPEVVEALCNHAIDQGDEPLKTRLLQEIRERSSWTWMIMQFGEACQNPQSADVDGFLRMLEDDGIRFAGPKVLYALFNYYFHPDQAGLSRAKAEVDRLIAGAMDDSGLIALHLRLLIALDRDDEACAFFRALPRGIASTAVLAPFGLYFMAREGRDAEARAGWATYLVETAHVALNARSSYPEEITLRDDPVSDDILAFITVFNGIEYVEWFLDYYRNLGVGRFYFCDNGSSDGTFEYLQTQPDVCLFRNTGSFAASACGVFWINHLMRRFGTGHWCLHLDMDEALVFPGMESGRSLHDLTRYLDSRGFEATGGLMVDIYPDVLAADPGANPFESSQFIDTDYVWMRNELPPYHFIKGGVRARLTGRSLLMTKSPLVKMSGDTAFIANNHQHTHLRMADVTVALLHYKFIGAFRDRVREAVDRQEHFQGARFYRVLEASVTQKEKLRELTSTESVRYSSTLTLLNNHMLKSSVFWDSFAPLPPGDANKL